MKLKKGPFREGAAPMGLTSRCSTYAIFIFVLTSVVRPVALLALTK
jgi:hypothetical protein